MTRTTLRTRRLLPLLLVAPLAIAGCASTASETPSTEPTSGGELTLAFAAEPGLLDPHAVSFTYSSSILRQVVDSLTQQDAATGQIVPWLAESWEISDDATEYTFTLRDDVTFSDGEKLDADAVVANFDDLLAQNGGTPSALIAGLADVEATDDVTVEFRFDEPNIAFLQATSNVRLGILSPATIADTPQADRDAGDIIGSGPFVFDSVDAQQEIVLSKRDDYAWPADGSENEGAAYLDSVVFQIVPESAVRAGSLLSGAIDVDLEVGAEQVAQVQSGSATLVDAPQYGLTNALLPNVSESSIFSDPVLRGAFAVAVDQDEVAAGLADNNVAATNVLTAASAYYTDFSDELAGQFDSVAEAEAALDEAGWIDDGSGIRSKDGQALQARVLLRPNPSRETALQVVQQQVKSVGIDLVIDVRDNAAATVGEDEGDYEFVLWSQSRNDPDNLRSYFDPNQGRNPTKATDDGSELYDLLSEQGQTTDAAERHKIVDGIVEIVLAESRVVPLYEQGALVGVADGVTGFTLDAANLPVLQAVSRG